MKILHVGKYYPPFMGGMETVLENLATGLTEAGHEVSVIVAGETTAEQQEIVTCPGGSLRLTRLASIGVVNSQPLTMGLVSALRREIQEFRPDLVHLHLPNPLLGLAWMVLQNLPGQASLPPFVIWYHADITRQKLGSVLVGPVVRWCLDAARGICVSSPQLLEQSPALKPSRDRVRTIPFGIAARPWSEVVSTLDGPFLFIGRLVPYKGLEILLKAVAQTGGVRLVLVGDGPLRGSLEARCQDLGLEDRVSLTGPLPRRELVNIMSSARGLVLPSLDSSETFGLVQLEAMAAGLPVVASDLDTGVGDVGVPDQTCLLVKPGDIAALGQALGGLQADPARCREMGERGRAHFTAHYSRDNMIEAVADWYDEILRTGSLQQTQRLNPEV